MELEKKKTKGIFIWGIVFWFFGYTLSMMLFPFVKGAIFSWMLFVFTIPVIWYVAFRLLHNTHYSEEYYTAIGSVWLATAMILDYLFVVVAYHVEDFYSLPIILNYLALFAIPMIIGNLRIGQSHWHG